MIHLSFLIRKLTCSISTGFVNYNWGLNFTIAGCMCLVEEKINQCTLDLCAFPFVNRKSRAADFNAEIEIYDVIFLNQLPMWQCPGMQCWNSTIFVNYDIFFRAGSGRNFFMGKIITFGAPGKPIKLDRKFLSKISLKRSLYLMI